MKWNQLLLDQLTWHWEQALRPRRRSDRRRAPLGARTGWSVRPREQAVTTPFGGGDTVIDFAFPEPYLPPVTTIAWRLAHVIVGCFGMRTASHLGGPAYDYGTHEYAATADEALAQLDDVYARWVAGVRELGEEAGLARPCGPAEGPFAAEPLATLVLHIHRELIHHGAEVGLLRDLYRVGRS